MIQPPLWLSPLSKGEIMEVVGFLRGSASNLEAESLLKHLVQGFGFYGPAPVALLRCRALYFGN